MTQIFDAHEPLVNYFNSHPHEEDDLLLRGQGRLQLHFNSHPHEEDDSTASAYTDSAIHFNSHPHEEDDKICSFVQFLTVISTHILTKRMTLCKRFNVCDWIFQLTSSRRGWHSSDFIHRCCKSFQLTSSRRGWQQRHWHYGDAGPHFNSHPHEEDDATAGHHRLRFWISTHILTKRMTVFDKVRYCKKVISTHILTKRMTGGITQQQCSDWKYFNSHPHEEDDQGYQLHTFHKNISTHILTKRMTVTVMGGTIYRIISTHILTKRMTKRTDRDQQGSSISTHILTKRMTGVCPCHTSFRCIFQLTSSRRGWHRLTDALVCLLVFQLTSSRRGWPLKDSSLSISKTFQLTSSRRGWRFTGDWSGAWDAIFQLTSSRRGWPNPSITDTYIVIFQLTSSRRGWLP